MTNEEIVARWHRAEALLWALAQATIYRFPDGTVGGNEANRRIQNPEVGDFVVILMAMAPVSQTMGTLVAIKDPEGVEPGMKEYARIWTVDCLDGVRRDWSNVKCNAIPVGSPFDDCKDLDKIFREKKSSS